MKLTAIVIGATGLVGAHCVKLLCDDDRFEKVKTFGRGELKNNHPKIKHHIVNFEKMGDWKDLITGDILFSALGTTIKEARNKEAQYLVDYTFQYNIAQYASTNKVHTYVLISSVGANENAKVFYSRMKGELDRNVMELPFDNIHILRPGLLVGKRKIIRRSEKIGYVVIRILNKLGLLLHFKPIHGHHLARTMIMAGLLKGKNILETKDIFNLLQGTK